MSIPFSDNLEISSLIMYDALLTLRVRQNILMLLFLLQEDVLHENRT